MIQAELRDPFWGKSHSKKYARTWGLSGRADPLSKLGGVGGGRDDGETAERRTKEWAVIDRTVGSTASRVVLNNMIGKPVLGPGPEYSTTEAFERTGRFGSFAAFQLQSRDAWRETAAAKLEKGRPKTPANLLTMNPAGSTDELPAVKKIKDKKKKLADAAALLEQMASPVKDHLGPGCYDAARPLRQELLSTLPTAGRTRIAPASVSRRRTKLNQTDLFDDRPDFRNYQISQEPGRDARKAFFTSEARAEPVRSTNARVGPGSYDVITALRCASPPSPKARWLAKYTFSKDEASAVPFSRTHSAAAR